MPQDGAQKMLDYRRRKREQGLRLVQLWAFDRERPEFQERLRREAELVRDHAITHEANAFMIELWSDVFEDVAERP